MPHSFVICNACIVILNAYLQLIWYDSKLQAMKTQCNTGIRLSMCIMWWCWISRDWLRLCATNVVYVLCHDNSWRSWSEVYICVFCVSINRLENVTGQDWLTSQVTDRLAGWLTDWLQLCINSKIMQILLMLLIWWTDCTTSLHI